MHVLHVVGARPNFMKAAPVLLALRVRNATQTLVHTGQHYDAVLSDAILKELDMPQPDVNLAVGSGSHASQTAEVLVGMENTIRERQPDVVLVYGDVNSTVAAALAAVKLDVAVAHIEAGLRSGDRTMPEEINRIVTDRLATALFTPSCDADANLQFEGIPAGWIHRVGNVMIDTLVRLLPLTNPQQMLQALNLGNGSAPKPFALVTLHRPSNVDDHLMLKRLLDALEDLARDIPVVFPMHPRTKRGIDAAMMKCSRITAMGPLTYLQFLALERAAAVVITDSGGIQEETTYLGVPCLTVRDNTERPVTITSGTNILVGRDPERLKREIRKILDGDSKTGCVPPLWDGEAAARIAEWLMSRNGSEWAARA